MILQDLRVVPLLIGLENVLRANLDVLVNALLVRLNVFLAACAAQVVDELALVPHDLALVIEGDIVLHLI